MASNLLHFLLLLISLLPISLSQPTELLAPSPSSDLCNGIFVSYLYTSGKQLRPTLKNPLLQPFSFKSTATILNNSPDELKSWKLFIGFQHDELLVSASSSVLTDGSSLPAKVGNGTVFSGFPSTDLKTAIETAGDVNQMMVEIDLVGTQFGVKGPKVPMPRNISLVNDGFACPEPTMEGPNLMNVCCVRDLNFKANVTFEEFLPRQEGDLTIAYDILKSFDEKYLAQVTIGNHNPLGRLDNWKLSWDWMRGEFINRMQGAYPHIVDSSDCFFGPQGGHYKGFDFSTILNCERRPTIVDLPVTKANDSVLGKIPACCRDGIILPPSMDPSKSSSAFQLEVFKMPPDLNKTELFPPQNWKINGTLNPDYVCGPPIRVSPSLFPDSNGLTNSSCIASWQVVCNITQKKASPRCCVSFSAFYNDSVIPCNTCACGCPDRAQTCSTKSPALLLPPDALLVPFDNRTAKAIAWADIKHRAVPNPLPCADNCGVSINWHVFTDFTRGWSARVTLFNWGEDNFPDWFAAAEFKKAVPGFEAMYSFNGTVLEGQDGSNNTIFMQGLPGLNYLVAEVEGANPKKDPPVPGKQQSVISFTKKLTPGINIVAGDGYPTKVFFNGEECSLPSIIPTNSGHSIGSAKVALAGLLATVVFMLMQQ